MKPIDLNVDIGEGFPHDAELLQYATSANVCCGEHAGSWNLTQRTVELCLARGIRVGAHPGFPDRESMGRRLPTPSEASRFLLSIEDQLERFVGEFDAAYVKPHGAFYNMLVTGSFEEGIDVTRGLLQKWDLPLMILPRAPFSRTIREGFADRAYNPDGTLVSRGKPGAVLEDVNAIRAQVLRLATDVDSICLHGDTPDCVALAKLVRHTLEEAGYEVRA